MPALLARNAVQFGTLPAYRSKEFGIWRTWTWAQAADEVHDLALGFLALGIMSGDHVAIIGHNCPELYWSVVAVQKAGGIPVPVYHDAAAGEIADILDHCQARFVISADQERVDRVAEIQNRLPALEHMLYVDGRGLRRYDRTRLHALQDVASRGRADAQRLEPEMRTRQAAIRYDDPCVMLYTSGTTERPKGVVLSNRNIIETARNSCEFDRLRSSDQLLAYLPMAWVGDFIFSIGQAYWTGFCVNCPESPDTMMTDLKEVGPTYYFAPPRVLEAQLTNLMIRVADAAPLKRWLYRRFMDHARRVGPAILDGKPVSARDRIIYRLGELVVYAPVKNALGLSRVRVGYTAGEAVGPDVFQVYRSLGINLKQLYGQTEAAAFITQQKDDEVRSDTVGTPTPGVQLKIGENGEVFYRSPGVFLEYYRNPEGTAATKDVDGWVATGDAGFIEPETGHLRIIDRAGDVSKMADGRLFAPKYVENKLKFHPSILQAVVFGAGRDYCTALINIDLIAVGNWAERNNITYSSYQDLAGHPQVLETVRRHVVEVNLSIATDSLLSGCQIRRFVILHKELDADDGELTRTGKVRRRIIERKFADLIEAIYSKKREVFTETEVTYEDGRKGKIKATLTILDAAATAIEQRSAA